MRQLQDSGVHYKTVNDRTLILIWTEESKIFRAQTPSVDLTDEVLNNVIGEHIPENHLFPPWCDSLVEVKQPLSPDIHVKHHYSKLLFYNGTPWASQRFMEEVKILETISKRPHPNVNKFLGCIRTEGDLIGGICLRKLECTLSDLVEGKVHTDRAPPFIPDVLISGIKAGIDHIHSFGLVHNDINPMNIMVDSAGNAVIIDFDLCAAVGAPCYPGTPGWSPCRTRKISAFENDFYGLDLVAKFIRGEYDGQDVDDDLGFIEEDDEARTGSTVSSTTSPLFHPPPSLIHQRTRTENERN